MTTKTTIHDFSNMLTSLYEMRCSEPEVTTIKNLFGTSRRFGFPFISELSGQPEETRLLMAAKLLISFSNTWCFDSNEDRQFVLTPFSQLYIDAKYILQNAEAGTTRLAEKNGMVDNNHENKA